MSDFLSKIPVSVQNVLVDGVKEAVSFLWHHITGEHDEKTAADIARATADHLTALAYKELQIKIGAVALEQALKELGQRAAEMQPWADDMMAKIKKMNEDDKKLFSPVSEFDESDTKTGEEE